METLKLNSNDAMRYAINAMGTDRVDKGGNPYALHLIDVVSKLNSLADAIVTGVTDEMRQAAILHDTVEDTDASLDDLLHYGFSDEVVRLVDALTHRDGERKLDYWNRVFAAGPEARAIKAADALSNANMGRLNRMPTERDMAKSMMYSTLHDYMIMGGNARLMRLLGYYEASEALARREAGEA